jgi:hypothetical protein
VYVFVNACMNKSAHTLFLFRLHPPPPVPHTAYDFLLCVARSRLRTHTACLCFATAALAAWIACREEGKFVSALTTHFLAVPSLSLSLISLAVARSLALVFTPANCSSNRTTAKQEAKLLRDVAATWQEQQGRQGRTPSPGSRRAGSRGLAAAIRCLHFGRTTKGHFVGDVLQNDS